MQPDRGSNPGPPAVKASAHPTELSGLTQNSLTIGGYVYLLTTAGVDCKFNNIEDMYGEAFYCNHTAQVQHKTALNLWII